MIFAVTDVRTSEWSQIEKLIERLDEGDNIRVDVWSA